MESYCLWTEKGISWYWNYPKIYMVFAIPMGAGFCPSAVELIHTHCLEGANLLTCTLLPNFLIMYGVSTASDFIIDTSPSSASSACKTTFNAAGPEQLFYQRRRKGSSRASHSMPTSCHVFLFETCLTSNVEGWLEVGSKSADPGFYKTQNNPVQTSKSQIRNKSTDWDFSSSGRWLLKPNCSHSYLRFLMLCVFIWSDLFTHLHNDVKTHEIQFWQLLLVPSMAKTCFSGAQYFRMGMLVPILILGYDGFVKLKICC